MFVLEIESVLDSTFAGDCHTLLKAWPDGRAPWSVVSMNRRIPMARSDAEQIAGSMIDASLLLLDLPATAHVNVTRLIDHAELLLDNSGEWMPRLDAIAVWTSILEDAVIPLEQTAFLGVAEELLRHYDRLTDLIQNS